MTDRTSIGCARDVSIKLFFSSQTLVEWKKTKAQQRPGGGGHTKWQQWRRKSNVCTQKEEESQTFSFFFPLVLAKMKHPDLAAAARPNWGGT